MTRTTQIRRGVFETNSSSSHSLTIPDDLTDLNLFYAGIPRTIDVELGYYGWEEETYTSPAVKLSYLFSGLNYGYHDDSAPNFNLVDEILKSNKQMSVYIKYLKEEWGCTVKIHVPEGAKPYDVGVDHQSVGTLDFNTFSNFDELTKFIFDRRAEVITDNDNR